MLQKGTVVFQWINKDDPEGENDADIFPKGVYLRGKAVVCVLDPHQYYGPGDIFKVYSLKKTLYPAHRGLALPGEPTYAYLDNGGDPLYLIQKVHLAAAKKRPVFDVNKANGGQEQPARKQRRASGGH